MAEPDAVAVTELAPRPNETKTIRCIPSSRSPILKVILTDSLDAAEVHEEKDDREPRG